ncbi:hypothetical protein C0J52_20504 [Blattella germanica]|nr:hypothetical protein C0J52_20504 [Blattella germanica]
MAQILGAFQERFNKAPPRKATLLDWERCAFAFGNVKNRLRSGNKTREGTCAGVAASIEQSPIKSTRKRAAELGIPRTTMRDHMKEDLKMWSILYLTEGYRHIYHGTEDILGNCILEMSKKFCDPHKPIAVIPFFIAKEIAKSYNIEKMSKDNEIKAYHMLRNYEDSNNYYGLLTENVLLQKRINEVLKRLASAGIVQKMFDDILNPTGRKINTENLSGLDYQTLDLLCLQSSFYVLMSGICLSTTLFLLEITVKPNSIEIVLNGLKIS